MAENLEDPSLQPPSETIVFSWAFFNLSEFKSARTTGKRQKARKFGRTAVTVKNRGLGEYYSLLAMLSSVNGLKTVRFGWIPTKP